VDGDGKLINDGHHPGGYTDLVCEHSKGLFIVLRVPFEKLLCKHLGGAELGVGKGWESVTLS
jgi:hypothetical protein